uniref:Uncharacterized protein n=1 Tax=Staphylococcus aureus TaxID=1280 RepID=Q936F0_STAAU|nr:unknown [Staphylococcus aureus]
MCLNVLAKLAALEKPFCNAISVIISSVYVKSSFACSIRVVFKKCWNPTPSDSANFLDRWLSDHPTYSLNSERLKSS